MNKNHVENLFHSLRPHMLHFLYNGVTQGASAALHSPVHIFSQTLVNKLKPNNKNRLGVHCDGLLNSCRCQVSELYSVLDKQTETKGCLVTNTYSGTVVLWCYCLITCSRFYCPFFPSTCLSLVHRVRIMSQA